MPLDRGDEADQQASEVFSSKAIGEPPLILCAAVTSAVRRAITSYRNDQVFLQPEVFSINMITIVIDHSGEHQYVACTINTIEIVIDNFRGQQLRGLYYKHECNCN